MTRSAQTNWQPLPFSRTYIPPASPPTQVEEASRDINLKPGDDCFALEQLNSLIRKVYIPGHRGGHRHVAFSSLERTGVRPWLSARIGKLLAEQVSENVCVVEVDRNAKLFRELITENAPETAEFAGPLGSELTHRVGHNLWLCPASAFLREDTWTPRTDIVRHRLSRLRREFGYLVIHTPPFCVGDEAVLMGQLSEGLVLVVEAHISRRAVAIRARRMLETMKVPLLGTILDQRTFPVPESIYRRI